MQVENKSIYGTGKIFDLNNIENANSNFELHKREVIKQTIISNLNQAITSYSHRSAGEYQLPVLTETDWDKVLKNISILAFVQGLPIGMKYYNNYGIATSTLNKEYVDPNEIYINVEGDKYYHLPYCKKIEAGKKYSAYKSIDYVAKTYEIDTGDDKTTYQYYLHSNEETDASTESCYYCLVDRASYKHADNSNVGTIYQTALARERYNIKEIIMPLEEVTDIKNPDVPPEQGGGDRRRRSSNSTTINYRNYIRNKK